MGPPVQIALVGDSDVKRWPEKLHPSIPGATGKAWVAGIDEGTVQHCVWHVREFMNKAQNQAAEDLFGPKILILIICAGENDVGDGTPLSRTEASLKALLGMIVHEAEHSACAVRAIFVGPKFEPWLEDDMDLRKAYVQVSNCIERNCKEFNEAIMDEKSEKPIVSFLDCVTMFCGETANIPGARLGGKAIPDSQYFEDDELHLSEDGYSILKNAIEEKIKKML